jgi:hypothetical protein
MSSSHGSHRARVRGRGGISNYQGGRNSNHTTGGGVGVGGASVKFLLQAPLRNKMHEPVSNNKWCFTGGYVGLFGDLMDNTPNKTQYNSEMEESIPEAYKENRRKRDGNAYHLTIMLRQDFYKASEKVTQLFAGLIDQIVKREGEKLPKNFNQNKALQLLYVLSELVTVEDFRVLGVGRVQQDNEETYFRVVEWESANRFLETLSLPRKDLHITLGFKNKDIHNVPKNETTLLSL